mmetsp:Transcript_22197/g.56895  ORF Transcript_22197/g.56895 Transcript_22197/m.56895 type:complete len:128 (+) Transcript_22197:486-869(+)
MTPPQLLLRPVLPPVEVDHPELDLPCGIPQVEPPHPLPMEALPPGLLHSEVAPPEGLLHVVDTPLGEPEELPHVLGPGFWTPDPPRMSSHCHEEGAERTSPPPVPKLNRWPDVWMSEEDFSLHSRFR